ncbi:MAG: hypothetical protein ACR2FG_05270 [Marmoricola sp.]
MRGLAHPVAAAVLALVLAAGLGACGDPNQSYCSAITKDQARLGEMVNSSTPDALVTDLPLLESLAAKSPDDLTDEWQTFLNAIKGLRDALKSAGLKASDVKGGLPTSVQGQQRRTLIAAADTLSSHDVVDAANGIETQARDVCKVNLGL